MFVHVVSRSLPDVSSAPVSGLQTAVDQVRRAGAEVLADLGLARGDLSSAVAECTQSLTESWDSRPPTVIHSVGLVATLAALAARPEGVPIVTTFHEHEVPGEVELSLARDVDGVIALSTAEEDYWRRSGARTLSAGALAVPGPAVDHSPATATGHIICLSSGPGLLDLVDSMPWWHDATVVLMGRLDEATKAKVLARARQLGVAERLQYTPGLRGDARMKVWEKAALLVALSDGSRHGGHVLEAASHGVPAVALAEGAHLDHIVPGATGVLVDPKDGTRGLGSAVASVLNDPLSCRGMGAAALVRVEALAARTPAGERLLSIYESVGGTPEARKAVTPLSAQATRLALDYLPLARQLAHRYAGRGQRLDDLIQVASLGLVRAASRFDPELGTEFHSFAVPTILGELRRHFRDHAWAARVPRSLQEMTLKVQRVTDELRSTLGHDPTAADIAQRLGLLPEEVLQAMQARGEAMSSKSLDHPMGEDGDEAFGDLVGDLDPDMEYVECREAVRVALAQLPEREREILLMRFYGEYTQSEIAEMLGLSQVHVSRLITRTLGALRDHVMYDVPLPQAWSAESDEEPEVGKTNAKKVGERAIAA